MSRQKTDLIIIHCSATPPSMDVNARTIDRWHRARGFLKIGYHFVIRRDGSIETGRELSEAGAHAKGYNHRSVGVCMVGGVAESDRKTPENNFTEEQWDSLENIVNQLEEMYPMAEVIGHCNVDPNKACPCFDVAEWNKKRKS